MTRSEVLLDIANMIIMDEPAIDFARAQYLAAAILSHIEASRMSNYLADEWEPESAKTT